MIPWEFETRLFVVLSLWEQITECMLHTFCKLQFRDGYKFVMTIIKHIFVGKVVLKQHLIKPIKSLMKDSSCYRMCLLEIHITIIKIWGIMQLWHTHTIINSSRAQMNTKIDTPHRQVVELSLDCQHIR